MSIAPPSLATGVVVEESEMSRKGQSFVSADAGRIENQGQQSLHVTTNEGREVMTTVQIGDVCRPLMSVSQVCDKGNGVLFTAQGGSILNLYDRQWIDFDRFEDTYMMDWWLNADDVNGKQPKPPHQNEPTGGMLRSFKDIVTGGPGFPRQGR